jgi:hypothetical protein
MSGPDSTSTPTTELPTLPPNSTHTHAHSVDAYWERAIGEYLLIDSGDRWRTKSTTRKGGRSTG